MTPETSSTAGHEPRLTSRDNVSAYLAVSKEIIHHQPAAMLSIIDGLVWPNLRVEVEVTAILPA